MGRGKHNDTRVFNANYRLKGMRGGQPGVDVTGVGHDQPRYLPAKLRQGGLLEETFNRRSQFARLAGVPMPGDRRWTNIGKSC